MDEENYWLLRKVHNGWTISKWPNDYGSVEAFTNPHKLLRRLREIVIPPKPPAQE